MLLFKSFLKICNIINKRDMRTTPYDYFKVVYEYLKKCVYAFLYIDKMHTHFVHCTFMYWALVFTAIFVFKKGIQISACV